MITAGINCPEAIELHEASYCLIIDGKALAIALGKPDNASTVGHLADARYYSTESKFKVSTDRCIHRNSEETIKGTTRTRRSKITRPIRRHNEIRDVPLPNNWKII